MSPIECAQAVADFIRNECIQDYVPPQFTCTPPKKEPITYTPEIVVRHGFLPKTVTAAEKAKQTYNVVVRPVEIIDSVDTKSPSSIELQILVQTYDDDVTQGHLGLYHIMELIRQGIMRTRTIGEYRSSGELKTEIPEEQPFPRWWGYMLIKFDLYQQTYIYRDKNKRFFENEVE